MAETDLPIVCTLSPNHMVDRLTEFETLFTHDLTKLEREPLRLRLTFDAGEQRETQIRELFAREHQCCAFLAFEVERTEAGVMVEVTAPASAGPSLDGIQALAERNTTPQSLAQDWTG